jgi:hypothetical protein
VSSHDDREPPRVNSGDRRICARTTRSRS